MMKRTITYSEMRSRRRCPYQGHLAYDEQTMLGAMYDAMAYDRERIESSGPMLDEEWEEIDERYELLRYLATRYVTYARENDPFEEIIICLLYTSPSPRD